MAGCDWVGSGSETVGDGGHLQPPSCHCGPLERAPEGGQALFGVPIFLCRLFSGKLSLLFIEIHCVKILRFVSRWTEKRVFCGKTFDYGVPIPSPELGEGQTISLVDTLLSLLARESIAISLEDPATESSPGVAASLG